MASPPPPTPMLTDEQRSALPDEVAAYLAHLEGSLASAQDCATVAQQAASAAVAAAQQAHAGLQGGGVHDKAHSSLPKPEAFSGASRAQDAKAMDVETWVFQFERYVSACNMGLEKYVDYAACLLRGPAAIWWRVRSQNGNLHVTWEQFKAMVIQDFKPVNAAQRARDRVATLRQTRSATEYCNEFRMAVLEIPDMSESWKLDAFFRGLKPNVQRELERYPPTDLYEAMRQAERIDAIDFKYSRSSQKSRERSNFNPGFRQSAPHSDGPVPMELGALNVNQQWGGQLSERERAELRAKGACFFCRGPGHTKFSCPNRNTKGQGNARPRQ